LKKPGRAGIAGVSDGASAQGAERQGGEVMRKSVAVSVLAILLLSVSSAYAAGYAGYYVGGGVGASFVRWEWNELEESDFEVRGADFAWKVFGGYNLIPFLALEGGYRSLGKVTDKLENIVYASETTGWDIEAMGILPMGVANFWAKVGFFRWSSEGGLLDDPRKESGTDFMWGLGAGISILNLGVRIEWEKFEVEDASHISMFTGGATFGF